MPNPRIFVSLGGQDDNLGDSILRRRLLQSVQSPESRVSVFVGNHTDSYISGLGLTGREVLHRSYRTWQAASIGSAATTRTHYLHNAGEIQVNASRARNAYYESFLLRLSAMRGGSSAVAGVGIRDVSVPISAPIMRVLQRADVVAWRDGSSRDVAGIGVVCADWAFGLGGGNDGEEVRDRVVLTFRSDRPALSNYQLRTLANAFGEHRLRPVVLTQVQRDTPRNEDVATALGCEHIVWESGVDHAAHEAVVRAVFRSSALVVSDRLHALIIGLTEGAGAATIAMQEDKKIGRTLSAAAVPVPTLIFAGQSGADFIRSGVGDALAVRASQLKATAQARSSVGELERSIRSAFGLADRP